MIENATYPKWKYHPEERAVVVVSPQDERELGDGWFDSPAHYGVETCPGVKIDKEILKNKKTVKK